MVRNLLRSPFAGKGAAGQRMTSEWSHSTGQHRAGGGGSGGGPLTPTMRSIGRSIKTGFVPSRQGNTDGLGDRDSSVSNDGGDGASEDRQPAAFTLARPPVPIAPPYSASPRAPPMPPSPSPTKPRAQCSSATRFSAPAPHPPIPARLASPPPNQARLRGAHNACPPRLPASATPTPYQPSPHGEHAQGMDGPMGGRRAALAARSCAALAARGPVRV